MDLVPRRIRMKVKISSPAGRRISLFWGPGPNPPLWGKENVCYCTLSASSSVPNMSWMYEWQYCYSLLILGWKQENHELSFLEETLPSSPSAAHFADVKAKACQVAKGTHMANRAEEEWYSYLFPKFLIKALSSTAVDKSHIIFKTRFRDASKTSPPPPWAHCNGAESCHLFLEASCMLWVGVPVFQAHSDISTLLSTFSTMP